MYLCIYMCMSTYTYMYPGRHQLNQLIKVNSPSYGKNEHVSPPDMMQSERNITSMIFLSRYCT